MATATGLPGLSMCCPTGDRESRKPQRTSRPSDQRAAQAPRGRSPPTCRPTTGPPRLSPPGITAYLSNGGTPERSRSRDMRRRRRRSSNDRTADTVTVLPLLELASRRPPSPSSRGVSRTALLQLHEHQRETGLSVYSTRMLSVPSVRRRRSRCASEDMSRVEVLRGPPGHPVRVGLTVRYITNPPGGSRLELAAAAHHLLRLRGLGQLRRRPAAGQTCAEPDVRAPPSTSCSRAGLLPRRQPRLPHTPAERRAAGCGGGGDGSREPVRRHHRRAGARRVSCGCRSAPTS